MLEVRNISATFGNFSLKEISFSLAEGKHLAIIGPTGAGKTSLMEIIAGVRKHKEGEILLDGKDISSLPPHKRNISMLYQHLSLFPHYTVKGNIVYPLRWRKEKGMSIHDVARNLGIEHLLDRRIHELSGGEKQRVALARALVTKPKILMLDEPLSAIDMVTKEQVITTIKHIQDTFHLSTILITHSPEEAYTLADYIAIIKNGKLVKYDIKENVWKNPEDIWFAQMIGIKNIFPIEIWNHIYPLVNTSDYTHVGIYPGDIKKDETGLIKGQIIEIVKYPHHMEVLIKTGNITLIWQTSNQEDVKKGGNISISISPENIYLLKEG